MAGERPAADDCNDDDAPVEATGAPTPPPAAACKTSRRLARMRSAFSQRMSWSVPGEHVELIQINGVFFRGWGGA